MGRDQIGKPEIRTIVFVDAVNFTSELKKHGREAITPKINQLKEFTEFSFVFKLKGKFIGKMGDGFLVLCPPQPPEVIIEALACQAFITGYNAGKEGYEKLNTRIAIHYGLISPPEGGNYIDTNLNMIARLEGATPPNSVCISSTLYDIVSDTLRDLKFQELKSNFKGLGENKYYIVSDPAGRSTEPTRRESRLSFYFATMSSFMDSENWESVKTTCEQALQDFPKNPEFTSQLGYALVLLGDYPGAIRAYEQCLAMEYEVSDSLLYIGRSYAWMGNQARAIEVLTESIEKDPKQCHAMSDIADIYLERGDYREAAKWAKMSLKANPLFICPIAILIVLNLFAGDNGGIIRLIKTVEGSRRGDVRDEAVGLLKKLGKKGHIAELGACFQETAKKK